MGDALEGLLDTGFEEGVRVGGLEEGVRVGGFEEGVRVGGTEGDELGKPLGSRHSPEAGSGCWQVSRPPAPPWHVAPGSQQSSVEVQLRVLRTQRESLE